MAKKNSSFIHAELDWAEKKLHEWQTYIDNHPIHELVDRIEWEETRSGTKAKVIATVEQQGKYIQDMMKNYLSLLSEVDNMREKEEQKKEARGRAEVPHRMK